MKRKRFPAEKIVSILRQAELGMAVSDIVRQLGISEQTFYRWKKQYVGMQVEGVRELKILQEENARLKKLVAGQSDSAGCRVKNVWSAEPVRFSVWHEVMR